MLIIRPEQMTALAASFEAHFVGRVRWFLQARTPDLAAAAGADLDRVIIQRRIDAESLGCETEQELVLYIVLSLLHGRDFTRQEPWAAIVKHHRLAKRRSGLATSLMDASTRARAPSKR